MAERLFNIAGQAGSEAERAAVMTRTAGGDLLVDMAFASEVPYERWWGIEVLQVNAKSVRLGRLQDGAPILFNHNWDDLRGTHVQGSVRCDKGGVLRGQIRLTCATQAGRDAIGLVEGGVLTKASVGYQIHAVIEKTTAKDGRQVERHLDGAAFERALQGAITRDASGRLHGDLARFRRDLDAIAGGPIERAADDTPVYLVTDWEPLENSLVTVPADNGVGVGRALEPITQASAASAAVSPAAAAALPPEGALVFKKHPQVADLANDGTTGSAGGAASNTDTRSLPAQPRQGPSALELEQQRTTGIRNIAKANNIPEATVNMWISSGADFSRVSEDVLAILQSRADANPQKSAAQLGLTDKETKRYSLFRALRAAASKGDWSQAGFELECSQAVAKKLGRAPEEFKFFVPFEVQENRSGRGARNLAAWADPQRRDLTVGTSANGGFLVGTDNMSFIEVLRNRSVAYRMGARSLTGLVGNVTVPRQTAAATAVWLANEASTATESQQTFGQMALSPKTVGAYTEISRQLLLQSDPSAEGIVTADLGAVCAIAVDAGVLNGSGASGQPTGITNTAGIGTSTAASIAYSHVLAMQTDVASANVMPAAGGYVTTPAVAALLMQRQRFTSTDTPLWAGNVWDGQVSGFNAMSSNQVTAATALFGDWSQVVVAEWGVLEVETNPYANFQAGIIGIRAMVSIDVGLRYAAAFSQRTSIT